MFTGQNIMRGLAPSAAADSQLEKAQADLDDSSKAKEKANRVVSIPEQLYSEFKEVNVENEKLFEFVTTTLLIQFLERLSKESEEDK